MASVVKYGNGLKRVEFSLVPKGPRKVVRLGPVSMKVAEGWATKIEEIIGDRLAARPHGAELSKWLGDLDETMLARMRNAGLADGVGLSRATLGPFLDGYIAKRSDTKPATRTVYQHTRRCLVEFFGADKPLRSITAGDADAWRAWLATERAESGEDGRKPRRLGENTIRRRCGFAKQFFKAAVRQRLIRENPFADLQGMTVRANRERDYFVTREEAAAVLNACPDAQWRLLFALSRFGGLRCPSEHLSLAWGDIDWERGRMTVRASKTEHHDGGGVRVLPIFPELRPYLEAVYDEAPEGTVYVIRRYRNATQNLRTLFLKIIKRAGLKPWPRLFHNLRATRQTELAAEFPLHVVCEWIGNSKLIAQEHYLRVTDADFDKAQQNAQQSAAERACQGVTEGTPEMTQPSEDRGFVAAGQSVSTDGKTEDWTILDSNQ